MNDDSFFSINRLVEFGLGLTVAQQMVKSMNEGARQMHVPGAMNPMDQNLQDENYFVVFDGEQAGPFSKQEIARLIGEQKIHKETYIWKPGMPKWKMAEQLPEILKIVALTPPPLK